MSYEPHPLADLIPSMTDAEYQELREDIRENGQREPITLYEGQILDGRHRYRACEELGCTPDTRTYDGEAPAAYVLSLNLHRRSLSTAQRAAIAVDFLPALEEEARKRQEEAGRQHGRGMDSSESADTDLSDRKPNRSYRQAAEMVGVGEATVGRAKRVKRDAPEEFEKLRRNETSVNAALSTIPAKPEPEPRQAPPAPKFETTTPRARKMAENAHRRLGSLVEMLDGARMGLTNFDVSRALAATSDEERKEWVRSLDGSIKAFSELRTRLRKGV